MYIMCNVQAYSVLYNNSILSVIYEDWHFPHMWKVLAWPHNFTKSEDLGPLNECISGTFYWYACTNSGMWGLCICILGVSILPLPTIFIFDFGIVPTMWYLLFFILFQLESQNMLCSWVLALESMKYVEYHGLTGSSHINTPILSCIIQHWRCTVSM